MAQPGRKAKRKEVVWSDDFAYAIGLMASDGCLSPDGLHLIFVSKELEQIENLMKCLDLQVKIGRFSSGSGLPKKYYRVQWGDVFLYRYLLTIGLTPNKSLTMGKLDIPEGYFFDFLRGLYDGDGCFYSYFDPRWKSSFMYYFTVGSGSEVFINWLQESIEELTGSKGHITRAANGRFFQIRYAKRESHSVLQKLYADPKATHLKRKKLKIAKALRIVNESLPVREKKT